MVLMVVLTLVWFTSSTTDIFFNFDTNIIFGEEKLFNLTD